MLSSISFWLLGYESITPLGKSLFCGIIDSDKYPIMGLPSKFYSYKVDGSNSTIFSNSFQPSADLYAASEPCGTYKVQLL